MTTGTKTLNGLYTWISSCGIGTSGLYKTKSWSGADQAHVPPPAKVVVSKEMPTYRLEPYVDPRGRRRIRKVVGPSLTVESHRRVVPYTTTPKRERRWDEHNYLMTLEESYYPPFEFKSAGTDNRWVSANSACGMDGDAGAGAFLAWSATNELELTNKLREKLVGEFDIGMFLVEADKSLAMIRNAAIRIGGAWSAARRGLWKRAENILTHGMNGKYTRRRKAAANNWLELQYGWLPLLHDAYVGSEQLARIRAGGLHRTVRTSRNLEGKPNLALTSNQGVTFFLSGRQTTVKSIKARIREVNVPLLTGIANPATMVWERLPYSFVLDWFLPIQAYLQASGVQHAVSGVFTYTLWQTCTIQGLGIKGTGRSIRGTSDRRSTYKRLERTVTTSLNAPLPSFKPAKKAVSWIHTVNAVALLSQLKR